MVRIRVGGRVGIGFWIFFGRRADVSGRFLSGTSGIMRGSHCR